MECVKMTILLNSIGGAEVLDSERSRLIEGMSVLEHNTAGNSTED